MLGCSAQPGGNDDDSSLGDDDDSSLGDDDDCLDAVLDGFEDLAG